MGIAMFYVIMIAMGLSIVFWAIELRTTINILMKGTWNKPVFNGVRVRQPTNLWNNILNLFIGIINIIAGLIYICKIIFEVCNLVITHSREFLWDVAITCGLAVSFSMGGSTVLVAAAFVVSDLISIIIIIYSIIYKIKTTD